MLHPKNPFAPTLHFNYRYFETDAPKGIPSLDYGYLLPMIPICLKMEQDFISDKEEVARDASEILLWLHD